MNQLDLSVFSERYKIIALIDSDPGSAHIRRQFVEKCEAANISICKLQRYAVENYFSVRALREVCGEQISGDLKELKPDVSVEKQLGVSVKKRNRTIARAMEFGEIEQTDFGTFIRGIEKVLKENAAPPANE
jgi:hypothetical protein